MYCCNKWMKVIFSFNKWVTYFLWYVTTLFFLAFLLRFLIHYYTVFLSLKWFLKLSFCLKKGFFVLFVIIWYIVWYVVLRNAVKKECNIEEKDVMPSKKRVAWSCLMFHFWCIHLLLRKSDYIIGRDTYGKHFSFLLWHETLIYVIIVIWLLTVKLLILKDWLIMKCKYDDSWCYL